MKICLIGEVEGIKVYGLKLITSNYDFRIGFLPLGNPDKHFYPDRWFRLKRIIYYSIKSIEPELYRHYRFLWFAVAWKTIKKEEL